MDKLELRTLPELTKYAIRSGLTTIDEYRFFYLIYFRICSQFLYQSLQLIYRNKNNPIFFKQSAYCIRLFFIPIFAT